jgi:hypothetical protein
LPLVTASLILGRVLRQSGLEQLIDGVEQCLPHPFGAVEWKIIIQEPRQRTQEIAEQVPQAGNGIDISGDFREVHQCSSVSWLGLGLCFYSHRRTNQDTHECNQQH